MLLWEKYFRKNVKFLNEEVGFRNAQFMRYALENTLKNLEISSGFTDKNLSDIE